MTPEDFKLLARRILTEEVWASGGRIKFLGDLLGATTVIFSQEGTLKTPWGQLDPLPEDRGGYGQCPFAIIDRESRGIKARCNFLVPLDLNPEEVSAVIGGVCKKIRYAALLKVEAEIDRHLG